MKTYRKVLFFVALMAAFYCLTLIQSTYAKYVTSATGDASITIARWNILVNTQDVVQNSNFSDKIVPIFEGNENISENVIAPTAEGYFDILVDGSQTDVSFDYTLSADLSEHNDVNDLIITKYIIDNVEYSYNDSITGHIANNSDNKTVAIRFYVKWNDESSTQSMNNEDDTAVTIDGNAAFNINLNVIQSVN